MEQRNEDLREQIKNLAGVNDEINQTNRRLQTENNSLRGEKEWLQKQIFELQRLLRVDCIYRFKCNLSLIYDPFCVISIKGGKSSANLISRLFKGKQK